MSNPKKNTQLTATEDYNTSNMIFSDVKVAPIPGKGKMTYKRINIQTKNADGTIGDLVFQSPKLFCFGIKQFSSEDSGKPEGRAMSLCLWGKDGATDDEKAFADTFEKVVAKCKKHLLANKEEIDDELHEAHLNKFSPIFRKKLGANQFDPDKSPVLSLKLVENKDKTKIQTTFWDAQGNSINPNSLQDQFCYVVGEICVESIYIGAGKYRLQVKLRHAEVEIVGTSSTPLLKRPKAIEQVLDGPGTNLNSLSASESKGRKLKSKFKKQDAKHDDDETGSIHGSDNDEDEKNGEPKKGKSKNGVVEDDEEEPEESPKPKIIKKIPLKSLKKIKKED